jgi:hypothetical protein
MEKYRQLEWLTEKGILGITKEQEAKIKKSI